MFVTFQAVSFFSSKWEQCFSSSRIWYKRQEKLWGQEPNLRCLSAVPNHCIRLSLCPAYFSSFPVQHTQTWILFFFSLAIGQRRRGRECPSMTICPSMTLVCTKPVPSLWLYEFDPLWLRETGPGWAQPHIKTTRTSSWGSLWGFLLHFSVNTQFLVNL